MSQLYNLLQFCKVVKMKEHTTPCRIIGKLHFMENQLKKQIKNQTLPYLTLWTKEVMGGDCGIRLHTTQIQ